MICCFHLPPHLCVDIQTLKAIYLITYMRQKWCKREAEKGRELGRRRLTDKDTCTQLKEDKPCLQGQHFLRKEDKPRLQGWHFSKASHDLAQGKRRKSTRTKHMTLCAWLCLIHPQRNPPAAHAIGESAHGKNEESKEQDER